MMLFESIKLNILIKNMMFKYNKEIVEHLIYYYDNFAIIK